MITRLLRRLPIAMALFMLLGAAYASAASADTGFEAGSYPVALTGTEINSLVLSLGGEVGGEAEFQCSGKGFESNLSAASQTLYTSFVNNYACNGGRTLEMNGCNFALHPGTTGTGSLGFGPPGCGPVYLKSGKATCLTVEPQTASATYGVGNEGSGSNKYVTAEVTANGLKHSVSGSCTGYGPSLTWRDAFSVKAKDVFGESVGLSFNNEFKEGAHSPRIEASSYTALLSGDGLNTLSTDAGTINCGLNPGESTLTGNVASATTSLDLSASYGECVTTMFGSTLEVSVAMNSCHYTLGVQNVGPPYAGTWGVACTKEGDAIEFKPFILGKYRRCIAIHPQSGLTGIDLSNVEGWGIGVDAEVGGLEYIEEGPCVTTGKPRTDGVMSGESTLLGSYKFWEEDRPVGVYLTGEGP